MRKFRIIVGILVGLVVAGVAIWIAVGMFSVAGIEQPKYEVTKKLDGFEIREYAPHIVAEVTVDGEFDQAINRGFREVADYIFGNNRKQSGGDTPGPEKIAMTAPVLEQEALSVNIAMTAPVLEQSASNNSRVVAFVMPGKYTLDTLPKPNNPKIRLVQIPQKKYAALRFSGWVSSKDATAKKQQLLDMVKREKLESVGQPSLAQYNPPWTPPFMRRNEILLELK